MSVVFFTLIFFVFCSVTSVTSNDCTDAADVTYNGNGIPISFCGTDGIIHKTFSSAVGSSGYTYDICGVMTQFSSSLSCGCPNDCFYESKQGECNAEKSNCICAIGYTGNDCSLPASGNSCSMHGKINDERKSFPFDFCECDYGFTGTDCSSSAIFTDENAKDNNTPWGDLFDNSVYTNEGLSEVT